ncbi:MAG: NAD-dependent epimerase/dehydratase family protein [Hyphomicrobium sp.]
MARRTALVTGASGFIGRHLVAALRDDSYDIVALVRRAGSAVDRDCADSDRSLIREIVCPSWSTEALAATLENISADAVFHMAAYGVTPSDRDADIMHAVNVAAAETLVRFAARCGAVMVSAGSSAEYREPPDGHPIDETAEIETEKLYGRSKAAGAERAVAIAADLRVPIAHLRLFNVYGPGEAEHRLLPTLVSHLLDKRRVPLSPGLQLRDFVFVGDAVDALKVAARHLQANRQSAPAIWNICSGRGTRVRDIAEMAAHALAANPELLGFGDVAMRPGEVPILIGSPERFYAATGWRCRFDLESGIARTVDALAARHKRLR